MNELSSQSEQVPDKKGCSEITVTIKASEKSLKEKFLIYERYSVNEDDPIIKDCIARTLRDFNEEPDYIRVRINLVVI